MGTLMVLDHRRKSKEQPKARPKTDSYSKKKSTPKRKLTTVPEHNLRLEIEREIEKQHKITDAQLHAFESRLKARRDNGEISHEDFLYLRQRAYNKSQGRKVDEKDLKKLGFEVESVSSGGSFGTRDIEKEEELKREKNIERERFEEHERMPQKSSSLSFLWKSKGFRLIIFVVVAAILLFFLTKSNLSVGQMSPFILILAILFIIFILGHGGKSKPYESLFS